MKKIKVAFVCTHNSCRSIMAEGWAKHLGSDLMDVYSAGTEVYPGPKPLALEVMTDSGVNMEGASSKLLSDIPKAFDILITMGCGVECPFVPCKHREDWGLDDPSGGPKKGFEETRDIIKKKVIDLIHRIKNHDFENEKLMFNVE
jgi:arsenate reductase